MRAEFSENLITGNELIDSQHKELIDRINKLLDAAKTAMQSLLLSKLWTTCQIIQSFISALKKSFRKTLSIRVMNHIRNSMKTSKRPSQNLTRCFRKKKVLHLLLLKKLRRTLSNGSIHILKVLIVPLPNTNS